MQYFQICYFPCDIWICLIYRLYVQIHICININRFSFTSQVLYFSENYISILYQLFSWIINKFIYLIMSPSLYLSIIHLPSIHTPIHLPFHAFIHLSVYPQPFTLYSSIHPLIHPSFCILCQNYKRVSPDTRVTGTFWGQTDHLTWVSHFPPVVSQWLQSKES